ncbi:zinc-ribbon domain-containing protein [Burkholderia pyrrocinia]|uniref:zinc-ribbon domain-containing protein n=1 Tax=Burkholderia pyrrocinia TaxID=60550 RepID=UPI001FC88A59|nr:zinc-ribbon domain-containing protein [Burkholderia pyrrocinia]
MSESYTGQMSRYRFRCAAGHEWRSFAGSILGGTWCTACRLGDAGEAALGRLHAVAAGLGWRCLSDTWGGYQARYEFECEKGHPFMRNAAALLYRGEQARCDACEEAEIEKRWLKAVAMRCGHLLNGPFRGLSERYRLRCAEGHEWETTGELIHRGKWCPECGRVRSAECNILADGLERLQTIAGQHGGRCLAAEYTRSRDHYLFECSKGHRWKASGQMVVDGHWCPKCAGIARRLTLDTMQEIARERGGLCLSTEYHGAHVKLTWQCHRGHVWRSSPANVKNKGRWCPNCAFLEMSKDPKKRRKWDFEGKE